jgi:tetratricopeptide (TPR) repeat protein
MNFHRKLLITFAALTVLSANCIAATGQDRAPARIATDSKYKADLDDAVALLDSWRGDSSVLDAARVKLDGILRSNPNVAAAHREYARYHIMSGYISGNSGTPASLAAAERSLNEALRIDPKYAEAYVLEGHLYFLQNRLADAASALAKAQEIGTTDPWLQLNTADVLIAEGKLDEAALRYQNVIASGTKNSKAMLAAFSGLIRFYGKTGRLGEVEETYKRQIAYEPQSAWPYGNYAAFLLCTKDDAGAAIPQFRNALDRMNYGMARSGLSAALYRKWIDDKQSEGANALFREAQSLRSGTPVEIVTSFCRGGPAVSAVSKANNQPAPPAR